MSDTLLTPFSFVQVALPVPMRTLFDYRIPKAIALRHKLLPGMRVKVPFGHSVRLGIIVNLTNTSQWDEQQIKPITSLHDEQAVMAADILALGQWASRYYHHPIGEVLFHALPVLLRKGEKPEYRTESWWVLTEKGQTYDPNIFGRAVRQREFFDAIKEHPYGLNASLIKSLGLNTSNAKALVEKQLIEKVQRRFDQQPELVQEIISKETQLQLNDEQNQALSAITHYLNQFHVALIDGITGSGKTEVYLQLIEKVIRTGKQVLVLVPEIGLTPQTLTRFNKRFNEKVVALHSNMNDRDRLDAWLMAKSGQADIIIGTRSAIFVPYQSLGLIVIDEEHDASYKQQEGFRYHARDLAIIRAKAAQIPVVLGSATPCFETLMNAWQKKYQWLKLRQRAGAAQLPAMIRVDLRNESLFYGFSQTTLQTIQTTLDRQEQVLIFLNRRGYAPTLMCQQCGWIASCEHCDVNLTVHKRANKLHCHHCDKHKALVYTCPECHSDKLTTIGEGTEQIEMQLSQVFTDTPIIRIDRDSTQRKSTLDKMAQQIHQHDRAILIGTQMLAKGHHFPNVTLVVIMNADSGLFSADYRGMEKTAQLIMQVAGRAGRASKKGSVLLQTYHPNNTAIETLCEQNYQAFAAQELRERQRLAWPPFTHQVIIRTESRDEQEAYTLLHQVRQLAEQDGHEEIDLIGPYAAIIVKKAGHHRYVLSLKSSQRATLHQLTETLTHWLETNTHSHKIRFAIDVDPLETY
ncbi:primosomal protein N' [Marinomonas agarivorans]|nr:primosomal protein N' [Marinomonas agarivorans]